jgi:hypothetical protein
MNLEQSLIAFKIKLKQDEYSKELEVVSVIPKDPPPAWSAETSHLFRLVIHFSIFGLTISILKLTYPALVL